MDLSGQSVLFDCSSIVMATPSFLDELVKQILVVRGAEMLEVESAPERTIQLLTRAARNRSVSENLREALAPSP